MQKQSKQDKSAEKTQLLKLDELASLDPKARLKEQLRILDTLMRQAASRGDSAGALRFFEAATAMIRRGT